jgi:hypothetical protein
MAAVSKFAMAAGIDPRRGLNSALTDLFAQLTPKYHEVFRERVKRYVRDTGAIDGLYPACSDCLQSRLAVWIDGLARKP